MKRIAINTGGGDAPGLNAVIRSIVLASHQLGWECWGIRNGFNGILEPEKYKNQGGGIKPLSLHSVTGITHLGGTILGTTNKGNPLKFPIQQKDGSFIDIDRSQEIINSLKDHAIDALISIGGDGSMNIAHALAQKDFQVIGVPKTIDNDLDNTDATFGFDTAVEFATTCIDRLHSTAEAHERIMVVEVMGRYAGWIALHAGVAGTADVILLPEIPYDINAVAKKIFEREKSGSHFSIIVVAEGAKPLNGNFSIIGKNIGQSERLGGAGDKVAKELEILTGKETRVVVLGHLQRGGMPTANDRLLSLRFGAAAVRAIAKGMTDMMVSLHSPNVECIPLADAIGKRKTVSLNHDIILTARELGIYFGDELSSIQE